MPALCRPIASVTWMLHQSTASRSRLSAPELNGDCRTTPAVQVSAFSGCRFGLPVALVQAKPPPGAGWADVGPGTLSVNTLVNYYLHYRSRELASNPLVDFVGTLGTAQNGLNPGAFEYRVLTTIGYGIGPARVSLQWQHLPSVEQESSAVAPTPFTGYPSYNLFNLNATYDLTPDIGLRFGVDNLLNKAPPIGNVNTSANLAVGQLPGGAFNSQFYDINGRRFYLGVNFEF